MKPGEQKWQSSAMPVSTADQTLKGWTLAVITTKAAHKISFGEVPTAGIISTKHPAGAASQPGVKEDQRGWLQWLHRTMPARERPLF
jgi:hypothetical protein